MVSLSKNGKEIRHYGPIDGNYVTQIKDVAKVQAASYFGLGKYIRCTLNIWGQELGENPLFILKVLQLCY